MKNDLLDLDKKVCEYAGNNKISGILRVTLKDVIIYEKYLGYACDENKTLLNRESMFTIYSFSKPFCAFGLLKLKDKGLVDLDVHPSKYVPEAAGFHRALKIRHLLHHVSGIPDFEHAVEFKNAHPTGYYHQLREQMVELAKMPSSFEPGTATEYANINFILCALIIENVTGEKYADYMKKEIFLPLGMENAVIDNESLTIENRVQGYDLINCERVPINKSNDWLFGAGDVVATVDDVYRINHAIKHSLLLKDETWEEILTPYATNQFGMGCTISEWHGKKRITHNGGHFGFRTLHIQLPEEDFDIILLSNSGYGNARNDLSEMIYSCFYGEDNKLSEKIEMDAGYI